MSRRYFLRFLLPYGGVLWTVWAISWSSSLYQENFLAGKQSHWVSINKSNWNPIPDSIPHTGSFRVVPWRRLSHCPDNERVVTSTRRESSQKTVFARALALEIHPSMWPHCCLSLPQSEAIVLQQSNQLKYHWKSLPVSRESYQRDSNQHREVTCGQIVFVLTRFIVSWFLHLRDTSFDFYWLAVTSWGQVVQSLARPLYFKILAGNLVGRSNQLKYHWKSLPVSRESYQREMRSNQYHKVTCGQIVFVLTRLIVSWVLQETPTPHCHSDPHVSQILPPISIALRWGAVDSLGNFLEGLLSCQDLCRLSFWTKQPAYHWNSSARWLLSAWKQLVVPPPHAMAHGATV